MKKMIAMLLCAVMLLCSCAMAESYGVTMENIYVSQNDMMLVDLSNLGIVFEAAEEDGNFDLRVALEAAGEEALALIVSGSADGVLASMTGVSDVYGIDAATLEMLASSAAEMVTDQIPTESFELPQEEMEAVYALGERFGMAVMTGMGTQDPVEIDGVTYEVMTLNVTEEALRPIIDDLAKLLDNYSEVLADTGFESFTDMVQKTDLQLSIVGELYAADDAGIVDLSIGMSMLDGSETAALAFSGSFAQGAAEDDFVSNLALSLIVGEEDITFGMDISGEEGSCDWAIPAGTEYVNITAAMENDAQMEKLSNEAMSALLMAVSSMASVNETVAAMLG